MPTFPETKKIIVVGAGLAGLTTAYRLQAAGLDVDLYEARNRVGGRVLSVYLNDSIFELGGQSFSDGGKAIHLNRLIEELGLELTYSAVKLNHRYFDGKELISVNQLLKNHKFNPDRLREQLSEIASHSHNMKEVLQGILPESDPLYKVLAVRLAGYEGGSIEQLSPLYTETLFYLLLGGISLVHQKSEVEEESSVNLISIKGGNALLPEKIGSSLGTRLHLNKVLTKITKNKEGSYQLIFQEGETVNAEILVLAIPCSVFENIAFEDAVIPEEKLTAIKTIQYGTNAKMGLPTSNLSTKYTGLLNDYLSCTPYQNHLIFYLTGETSQFSPETIQHTYAKIWDLLERGYGSDCPPFVTPTYAADRHFVNYKTPIGYSWPNDPYVKGSYSYITAGQETLLTTMSEEQGEKYRTLFAPIHQNLYFAGEHASILLDVPGTMEAACESGERIARAIATRIKQNKKTG